MAKTVRVYYLGGLAEDAKSVRTGGRIFNLPPVGEYWDVEAAFARRLIQRYRVPGEEFNAFTTDPRQVHQYKKLAEGKAVVINGAGHAFNAFREAFSQSFNTLGNIIGNMTTIVSQFFGLVNSGTSPTQTSRITGFFNTLTSRFSGINDTLEGVLQGFEAFHFFLSGTGTQAAFATYTGLLDDLAQTDVAQSIFGDDVSSARLNRFFRNTLSTLTKISDAAKDIGAGLIANLFGVGDATRLARGLSSLLDSAVRLIQNFTGLDLSEVLIDLDQGNFTRAIGNFAQAILGGLRDVLFDSKDQIVDAVSFVLNFALNPFRLLEIISTAISADGLAEIFGFLGDQLANFMQRFIGTLVDTLGGQSIGEAMLGNFGSGAQDIATFFQTIQNVMITFAQIVQTAVIPIVNQFAQTLAHLWGKAEPAFINFLSFVQTEFAPVFQNVIGQIAPIIQQLPQVLLQSVENIGPIFLSFAKTFIQIASDIGETFNKFIIPALIAFGKFAVGLFSELAPIVNNTLGFIGDTLIPQVVNLMRGTFIPAFQEFVGIFTGLLVSVLPFLQDFVGFFASRFAPLIQNGISKLLIPAMRLFVDTLRAIQVVAAPLLFAVAQLFTNLFWPPIKLVLDLLFAGLNTIITVIGTLITAIDAPLHIFVNVVTDAFRALFPIVQSFANLISAIVELFFAMGRLIVTPVRLFVEIVGGAFISIIQSAVRPFANAMGDVVHFLGSIWQFLQPPFEAFANGVSTIFGEIQAVIEKIVDFIQGLIDEINRAVDAAEDAARSIGLIARDAIDIPLINSENIDEAAEKIKAFQDAFEKLSGVKFEFGLPEAELRNFLDTAIQEAVEEGGSGPITNALINELNQLVALGVTTRADIAGIVDALRQAQIESKDLATNLKESSETTDDFSLDNALSDLEALNEIIGNPIKPEDQPKLAVNVEDSQFQDFKNELANLNEDLQIDGELGDVSVGANGEEIEGARKA